MNSEAEIVWSVLNLTNGQYWTFDADPKLEKYMDLGLHPLGGHVTTNYEFAKRIWLDDTVNRALIKITLTEVKYEN